MRIVKEAEERQGEILDAAERLFAEKGFDHTSISDIQSVVKISRGTLYYHFKSKEEILNALIERTTGKAFAAARAIVEQKEIPVLQRFTAMFSAVNDSGDIGREIEKQIHRPQNALMHQKMQSELLAVVCPLTAKLIEEGAAQGICRTDHPYEVAEMTLLYANTVFDTFARHTSEELERKITAFIRNVEILLEMEPGSLREAMRSLFAVILRAKDKEGEGLF